MNQAIFTFMEAASPYLVLWSSAFTVVTAARLVRRLRRGVTRVPDSAAFTELAGLPLTLMQPVCFVWAVVSREWTITRRHWRSTSCTIISPGFTRRCG
jgi:hypothetical protein